MKPISTDSASYTKECSKRRPDILYETIYRYVIVEIDENQHKSYEDRCECARINEITSSLVAHYIKPVIFVRYNPDVVKNKGKTINYTEEYRLKLLLDVVKGELNKAKNSEEYHVELIQLFYDDNYSKYKETKKEDITKLVTAI